MPPSLSASSSPATILATNTHTRKTTAETVATVLVHHGTNLYNLEVKTTHSTAVIHTTTNHLFWDRAATDGSMPTN